MSALGHPRSRRTRPSLVLACISWALSAAPARAQAPAARPAAPARPCPGTPSIAILDPQVAPGIDPAVGRFVGEQLRRTAESLGYTAFAPEIVAAALGVGPSPGAVGAADAARVAERLSTGRAIVARVGAGAGAYVVELSVVAPTDPSGPLFAQTRAPSTELVAAVDRSLRSVLQAPPGGPACVGAQARPPAPIHWRLALQTESAFGVSPRPGDATLPFYNHLAGGRLDYRFTEATALGAYVGYANLKGKDGRTGNVLSYVQLEYRLRADPGDRVQIPLKFATGYLPKNGPVARFSAGASFALSDRVDLGLDLLAPMVWVTRKEAVLSMDVAAELCIKL